MNAVNIVLLCHTPIYVALFYYLPLYSFYINTAIKTGSVIEAGASTSL